MDQRKKWLRRADRWISRLVYDFAGMLGRTAGIIVSIEIALWMLRHVK